MQYGWAPSRVENAILKFADFYGSAREVYYPNSSVVSVNALPGGKYSVSESPLRVARTSRTGYTDRAEVKRKPVALTKEASMATRAPARKPAATPAKRGTRKAKVDEPEPEEVEEEELEEDEDLEDEAEEQDEEESDEDDESDEDEDEDEEDDEDEQEAKDYTGYADKAPTPTMSDFCEWLLDNVFGGELPIEDPEEAFQAGVRLGGTLRIEFQQSDFCKQRREERRAESRKAAKAPAKTGKTTARQTAGTTAKVKPGAAVGKPEGRPRPAAAKSSSKATPAKRTTRRAPY
jgi:hypothetical protein